MRRKLDDLHPEVHLKAKLLLTASQDISIPILIYSTLRTFAEQQAEYDKGRKSPGKVVTNAAAGESYHNYGLALDFVPTDPAGRPKWDDLTGFQRIGEIAEELGFQWGGRWPAKDRPHLQMSFGYSWHDLFAFYQNGGLHHVWDKVSQAAVKWP